MPRNLGISLSHRVTARFGGTVNNRSKKILVALLALGSLFGISSAVALTQDFTVSVVVTDSTPDNCTSNIQIASWSPDTVVDYGIGLDNSADLYSGDINYRTSVPFQVELGFAPGSDLNSCDPVADYRPSGTVTSSFSSSQGLQVSSLECSMESCDARILYTDDSVGTVAGALEIPSSVGTFAGILTVTWTP
jgi:hypothetical protein